MLIHKNGLGLYLGPMKSRPTRPTFSEAFGAPPYGTPRSTGVKPRPPRPQDLGGPASGTPRQAPVLDTLVKALDC